ncbi:MAG: ammonia-forming cytochrome c nitrite reductase subunit c552 [Pirellulales bacterium]|nr:ammonia-forming cytochrome c nitrite reductase subunit c552 [Pirellulales bacterium]
MNDSVKDVNSDHKRTLPGYRGPWMGWMLFAATTVAVFFLGLLFASIMERRNEAKIRPPLVPIDPLETDSSQWAANWPREFASYMRMQEDATKTKYGGSFARDYLEETPANVVLFAGYGFAEEYKQARGHIHAVEDVRKTKRVNSTTPATCWSCKSPDVPRKMIEYGRLVLPGEGASFEELLLAGAGDFYAKTFHQLKGHITHPIGCLDCHDPETMQLRISRPALIEAFKRQGRDINQVSHQEMRTLVCAQCHVEYYFKGDGDYLTFPWDEGTTVENMDDYYAAQKFSDWTHAISKAPMVKMQHPDYEVYGTGIHAFRDVSCVDCHMPYRTEGGVKYTDHHVQSPLLNIANSCSVCHRWGEEEIRSRVASIQDKVREGRDRSERVLSLAHFDIAACMEVGANDDELTKVRDLVRRAQLRWDYVAANNGMGFHSPQECMRILTAAVELAQECRLECGRILALKGYTNPVKYPDYSTKESAQRLIRQFTDGNPPSLLAPGVN